MKKIHNKDDVKINKESGQTAMELAVFGSIFIFTMGLIVRTALGYGYQQGQTLKAMRMAMRMSYMYSSGQMGSHGDNNASRNSATVVLIEDRLTSSSAKYGTVDRVPYMLSGAATHSRNLFLNIDSNEDFSLSVVDYWINGQRFPFSNARFINVPLNNGNPNWDPMCARTAAGAIIGCVAVYEKIPNHDGIDDWDAGCDVCFDLNRDGTSDEVPAALRPVFSWQWKVRYAFETKAGGATLLPGRIAMETEQVSYDVDGDYQEETVYSSNGSDADGVITSLHVIDYQEGDLDSSWQPGDPGEQPGIQRDTEVFTFLRGQRPGEEGTYAIVEEGRLYAATPGRQFIRTAKKKDQVDIIQREIQLSNFIDGRFCNADLSVPAFIGDDTSVTNPVEVCVRTRQACFGGNMPFTCMAIDDRYIFVRSRIADRRGHKWVTDTTDEPYVEFMR
ncbi:MAG: hypothetical protein A2Y03_04615 [Omnitrophica WOR_2 bacterium GWF2_38_59]|nr:MAG: hypothetical protein A2Y03_04615 [Omnitrophica WOR_2 bacterium GWF2_38_59]OGX49970.1 MAG: hypothetical protein A2243_11570 [Omnitrophica WOR_2 bacterium RIFOXYA2_FULL_38_17]OGX53666.1 MAG: hypothetical protein A2267_09965 [Omnitrophica WOR_2 bacterium RIFOXYA12_FULL_38_10]HBG60750.1 hypothetical protein [Candidatus Omnitrophota bacterium]